MYMPVPPSAELLVQLCVSFVRSSVAGLAEFVSRPRQACHEAVDTTLLSVENSIGDHFGLLATNSRALKAQDKVPAGSVDQADSAFKRSLTHPRDRTMQ